MIAAKYDVAISTACSGLDYIVVETTNAAQACVELLRRENLGVATFMILVFPLAIKYFEFYKLLTLTSGLVLLDLYKQGCVHYLAILC